MNKAFPGRRRGRPTAAPKQPLPSYSNNTTTVEETGIYWQDPNLLHPRQVANGQVQESSQDSSSLLPAAEKPARKFPGRRRPRPREGMMVKKAMDLSELLGMGGEKEESSVDERERGQGGEESVEESWESKASDQRQLLGEMSGRREKVGGGSKLREVVLRGKESPEDHTPEEEGMDEDARDDRFAGEESTFRSYEEFLNRDSPTKVQVKFGDSLNSSLLAPKKEYSSLFAQGAAQHQTRPTSQPPPVVQSTGKQPPQSSVQVVRTQRDEPPPSLTDQPPGILDRLTTNFWSALIRPTGPTEVLPETSRQPSTSITTRPNPQPKQDQPPSSQPTSSYPTTLRTRLRSRYGVLSASHPWTLAHMRTLHRMLNSATSGKSDSVIPTPSSTIHNQTSHSTLSTSTSTSSSSASTSTVSLSPHLNSLISSVQTSYSGNHSFVFTETHAQVIEAFMAILVPDAIVTAIVKGEIDGLGDSTARKLRGCGTTYINRGLVAYGTVPADARDKFGDTLGGFGSAAAPDVSSFTLTKNGSIQGTIFATPDRGWNTEGSIDYQARVHKFELSFNPTFDSIANATENLALDYQDTTLLFKDDQPTTGLDADYTIPASDGFPVLPAGKTSGNGTVPALDLEGLVLLRDGSYWISDEYGPYIYHFTREGQMTVAIRPPQSLVPYTDGQLAFTSGNPPVGSGLDEADDPDSGRANNHGFEGLAISTDERFLTAQLQEAAVQDGGTHATRQNNTRQLTYDVTFRNHPRLVAEYIVQHPGIFDPQEDKNPRATSISDIHYLSPHQFFTMTRDSGHGRGSGSNTPSTYRHIDIVNHRDATNILDQEGPAAISVAPNGYLLPNIVAEDYCPFIDFNNDTDLARFNLHNGGGSPYATELNEKWESIAIIPVPYGARGHGEKEFYIVSISDNDFITQNGYYDFGRKRYADASGEEVSTQVLVWQAHLPNYVARVYEEGWDEDLVVTK
ncbi:3-phytase [Hortaea werneckii]|nr:3-phytase [Hortaea werneckii]